MLDVSGAKHCTRLIRDSNNSKELINSMIFKAYINGPKGSIASNITTVPVGVAKKCIIDVALMALAA